MQSIAHCRSRSCAGPRRSGPRTIPCATRTAPSPTRASATSRSRRTVPAWPSLSRESDQPTRGHGTIAPDGRRAHRWASRALGTLREVSGVVGVVCCLEVHRVRMAKLMGRQAPAHPARAPARRSSRRTAAADHGRSRLGPCSMQHAEQRADGQLAAILKPRLKRAPRPRVPGRSAVRGGHAGSTLPIPFASLTSSRRSSSSITAMPSLLLSLARRSPSRRRTAPPTGAVRYSKVLSRPRCRNNSGFVRCSLRGRGRRPTTENVAGDGAGSDGLGLGIARPSAGLEPLAGKRVLEVVVGTS